MEKLSIRIYLSFIREYIGIFLLITIGMTVTLLGVSFIFSSGARIYQEEAENNCETRRITITTNENCEGEAAKELYNLLFLNNSAVIQSVKTLDRTTNTIGYYSSNDSLAVPYGRGFQSVDYGKNVVLLSDGFLSSMDSAFLPDMLNSTISIKNKMYAVLGRYNSTIAAGPLSQEVIIPFKTYIYNGFPVNGIEIIFATKPPRQQLNAIQDFFSHYGDIKVNLPRKLEVEAIIRVLEETASHFIILMICYATLFQLLRYWVLMNDKKFYIYYMYGCTKKRLYGLLLLNTCYLYVIPAMISLCIYKTIEPYFSSNQYIAILRPLQLLAIYFIALILALLFTFLASARQFRNIDGIQEMRIE